MTNLLIRKAELFGPLSDDDKRFLEEVVASPRDVAAQTDLAREGESSDFVRLILDGFACRYKLLADGSRHIMAYLVPGDMCDFQVFILKEMDHSIGTLARSKVVDIPRKRILELTERPAIARAFWMMSLVDAATLREWLVNLGQRPAEERVAHLFCELHLRMKSVGLADGNSFSLPITQVELGDTMGITGVHANRVLRSLRADKLITLKHKELVILDPARLYEMSGFNPNYLHLPGGSGNESGANTDLQRVR